MALEFFIERGNPQQVMHCIEVEEGKFLFPLESKLKEVKLVWEDENYI